MSLVPEEIARVDALLAALDPDTGVSVLDAALRRLLPGIACRHCDAGDVLEEPFRNFGDIDLHLLDTSGHCIRVVDEPNQADAFLLAVRVPA